LFPINEVILVIGSGRERSPHHLDAIGIGYVIRFATFGLGIPRRYEIQFLGGYQRDLGLGPNFLIESPRHEMQQRSAL
jgi:hypothetical protein